MQELTFEQVVFVSGGSDQEEGSDSNPSFEWGSGDFSCCPGEIDLFRGNLWDLLGSAVGSLVEGHNQYWDDQIAEQFPDWTPPESSNP